MNHRSHRSHRMFPLYVAALLAALIFGLVQLPAVGSVANHRSASRSEDAGPSGSTGPTATRGRVVFAVTETNHLARFDSGDPAATWRDVGGAPVTNAAGETLDPIVGLGFKPGSDELWAFTHDGGINASLFTLDPASGQATLKTAVAPVPVGTAFGMAFENTTTVRIVSDTGWHGTVAIGGGAATPAPPLHRDTSTADVVALATTGTDWFVLDVDAAIDGDHLATLTPGEGTVTSVAELDPELGEPTDLIALAADATDAFIAYDPGAGSSEFAAIDLANGDLGTTTDLPGDRIRAMTVARKAVLRFTTPTSNATEGADDFPVGLTRAGGVFGDVEVSIGVHDDTSAQAEDYDGLDTSLVVTEGNPVPSVTVGVVDDTFADSGEKLALELTGVGGPGELSSTASQLKHTITLLDDDVEAIELPVTALDVEEGDTARLTVRRPSGSMGEIVVPYSVAVSPDGDTLDDIASPAGQLVIPDGASSADIAIVTLDDHLLERSETFTVTLGTPSGGVPLGSKTATTITIRDDDLGVHVAVSGDGLHVFTFAPDPAGPTAEAITTEPARLHTIAANGTRTDVADPVVDIDVNPDNRSIIALTGTRDLYRIDDLRTGKSTKLGAVSSEAGSPVGMTFEHAAPLAADVAIPEAVHGDLVLRVVGDQGKHVVVKPENWSTVRQGSLAWGVADIDHLSVDPLRVPPLDPNGPIDLGGPGIDPSPAAPAGIVQGGSDDEVFVVDLDAAGGRGAIGRLGSTDGTIPRAAGQLFTTRQGLGLQGIDAGSVNLDADADGIAYLVAKTGTTSKLWTIDLDTGSRRQVTDLGSVVNGVALAPISTIDFQVTDPHVTESAGAATIALTRTGGTLGNVSVRVSTVALEGGATPATEETAGDYTPVSDVVTFEDGETTATVSIPIVDDERFEGPEDLGLELAEASAGTRIGIGTATLTIDDDPAGALAFAASDPHVTEPDEGDAAATITVTRTGGSEGLLEIGYETSNGSATPAGEGVESPDYTDASGTLTFSHGVTAQSFDVVIHPDAADEPDETVLLSLANGATATLTIVDVDDLGRAVVPAGQRAAESDGATTLTIERVDGNDGPLTIDYTLAAPADRPATPGEDGDFTAASSGTISFPDQVISATIPVTILQDVEIEGPERIEVVLTDPATGTEVDRGVVEIADDEPGFVYASTADGRILGFDAVDSGQIDDDRPVTGLRDGERIVGIDFRPATSTLYLVTNTPRLYTLEGAGEAWSATEVGEFTTDGLVVGLDVDPTRDVLHVVTDADQSGDVDLDTAEFTAGADLHHEDGTDPEVVAIAYDRHGRLSGLDAATDTLVTIATDGSLTRAGDHDVEAGDALDVLSDGTRYALLSGAMHLLGDAPVDLGPVGDESVNGLAGVPAGVLRFASTTFSGAEGQAVDVVVERIDGTFGTVGATYTVATSDGEHAADPDEFSADPATGTLTFAEGETRQQFTVPLGDDELDEFDETVRLSLSDPTGGAALGTPSESTLTIVDTDVLPVVSVNDVTVSEGDSGTTTARFTVTLTPASGRTVTVRAATESASAHVGSDVDPFDRTLTFAPGETTATVAVGVRGDDTHEDDEQFRLRLSAPIHATLGRAFGVATIRNDDVAPAPEVLGVVVEQPSPAPAAATTASGEGYWIVTPTGAVEAFGDAEPMSGIAGRLSVASHPGREIVSYTSDQSGKGLWLLDRSGGVHTVGKSAFHGSIPGRRAAGADIPPVATTDIAATPTGEGYVVLDADGGIHTFGDAQYFGSIPGRRAAGAQIGRATATSVAITPTGEGYVVLDADGGIHTFGDAQYFGSIPGRRAAGAQIGRTRFVGITMAPGGAGYWILDREGGVHTFGDAPFKGSIPGRRAAGQRIGAMSATAVEATPSGDGYWVFDSAGGVHTFGDATFAGSVPGRRR